MSELLASSISQIIGCSCCCLLFALVVGAIAALAFRSSRPKADAIDGLAAPDRGTRTTASLTKLENSPAPKPAAPPALPPTAPPVLPEEEAGGEGQTVVISRPSSPPPPPRGLTSSTTVDPTASAIAPSPIAGPPRPMPPPPPRVPPPTPDSSGPPKPPEPPKPPSLPKPQEPPPTPAGRAFVPGRTIVVDDSDDVPMPPPRKKE